MQSDLLREVLIRHEREELFFVVDIILVLTSQTKKPDSMSDLVEKRRQFLLPHVVLCEILLTSGLNSLRYFRVAEADNLQVELEQMHKVLIEMPSKEAIKEAVSHLDDVQGFMCHLWARAFIDGGDIDETYAGHVDRAQMEYLAKVSKAFENRRLHAPGFDGQGGGRGRNKGT